VMTLVMKSVQIAIWRSMTADGRASNHPTSALQEGER